MISWPSSYIRIAQEAQEVRLAHDTISLPEIMVGAALRPLKPCASSSCSPFSPTFFPTSKESQWPVI